MPDKTAEKDIQQEGLDDLSRRYRHGFFVLNSDKAGEKAKPIYLHQVDADNNGLPLLYLVDAGGSLGPKPLQDCKLVEVYPDRGLYNYIKIEGQRSVYLNYNPVLHFMRKSRRQWSHGIRQETCYKDIPFGDVMDYLSGAANVAAARTVNFDWNTIYSLFSPWYPETWDEAINYLDKNPAVALTKDFMLMHDFTEEKGLLLTKSYQIIGTVVDNKIDLREGLLAQEVTDLIKRKKFNGKFELGGSS